MDTLIKFPTETVLRRPLSDGSSTSSERVYDALRGSTWSRAANTWNVAPAYVEGLIRPGAHKTLRGIGKRLAINEHRVRRFISESSWEHDAVQNCLNRQIPEAMLIVDDVDVLKHGHQSAGVAQQYAGSIGGGAEVLTRNAVGWI